MQKKAIKKIIFGQYCLVIVKLAFSEEFSPGGPYLRDVSEIFQPILTPLETFMQLSTLCWSIWFTLYLMLKVNQITWFFAFRWFC